MADETQTEKDLDYRVAQLEEQVEKLQNDLNGLTKSFNTFLSIMLTFMENPKVKAAFQITGVPTEESAKPVKAAPKPGPPKPRKQQ